MFLFVFLACDEHLTPCEEAAFYDPTLTLAVGEEQLEPIESGDELQPVWGPQGGQHVWVGAITSGLEPGVDAPGRLGREGPIGEFTLEDEAGKAWGWAELYGTPMSGGPEQAELPGQTLMLDWQLVWPEESEEPLPEVFTLRARLEDTCGSEAEASVGGLRLGEG